MRANWAHTQAVVRDNWLLAADLQRLISLFQMHLIYAVEEAYENSIP
jgi:hypothetical protein